MAEVEVEEAKDTDREKYYNDKVWEASVRAANRSPSTDHCLEVEHRNSEWDGSTGNSDRKGRPRKTLGENAVIFFFFSKLNLNC